MNYRYSIIALLTISMLASGCANKANPPRQQANPTPQSITRAPGPDRSHTPGTLPAPSRNLSTPDKDNAATPDLAGGPESKNRQRLQLQSAHQHAVATKILFFSGPRSAKRAALTFDDGPDVHYTTQILDVLKQHGVKATFFIMGTRAQAHPDMVRRIANEGHVIGNHTWDHPKLPKESTEALKSEIDRTNVQLHSILGYYPALFRPPYGAATQEEVRMLGTMGYKVINWSVDTRDWSGTAPLQILHNVRREAHPGAIILEHCAGGKGEDLSNTVQALPQIIALLKSQGYSLVTVPELLNIPARK